MFEIVKIIGIVIALVLFLRLKMNLTLSVFLSSILAILLFRINLLFALKASMEIVVGAKTVQLLMIIWMVLFLGSLLKQKGMLDKLIRSLSCMLGDRRIVAMIGPSIIGFLPSPGGALLSAPLVEVSIRGMAIKPEFATFLNYWFRHFWEFIWPVYAGLLIFQSFSEIPLKTIILYQSPFTLLNILTGILVVFLYFKKHRVGKTPPVERGPLGPVLLTFLQGIWPIFLIILFFFAFSLPLDVALLLVAMVVTVVKRLTLTELKEFLFSKFVIKTMGLILVVMVFQKMITISNISTTLKAIEVSGGVVIFLCFFISFVMGFLTGVNTAYIVIAFPILYPLIQGMPNYVYLSLYIYVVGFAGILYSPLHLCLVLTNEYFKSSLYRVYKYLTFPVLVLVAVSTLLVILL